MHRLIANNQIEIIRVFFEWKHNFKLQFKAVQETNKNGMCHRYQHDPEDFKVNTRQ